MVGADVGEDADAVVVGVGFDDWLGRGGGSADGDGAGPAPGVDDADRAGMDPEP